MSYLKKLKLETPVPFRNLQNYMTTTMSPVASINTTLVTSAYSPSFATGTTIVRGPQVTTTAGGEKTNVMIVSTPATFTNDATSYTTKSPFNTSLPLETSIAATSPNLLGESTSLSQNTTTVYVVSPQKPSPQQQQQQKTSNTSSSSSSSTSSSSSSSSSSNTNGNNYKTPLRTKTPDEFIQKIFESIDIDKNGRISVSEAEKILLRVNTRLNRKYGETEVNALFQALDVDRDGTIDFEEFKAGFHNLGV